MLKPASACISLLGEGIYEMNVSGWLLCLVLLLNGCSISYCVDCVRCNQPDNLIPIDSFSGKVVSNAWLDYQVQRAIPQDLHAELPKHLKRLMVFSGEWEEPQGLYSQYFDFNRHGLIESIVYCNEAEVDIRSRWYTYYVDSSGNVVARDIYAGCPDSLLARESFLYDETRLQRICGIYADGERYCVELHYDGESPVSMYEHWQGANHRYILDSFGHVVRSYASTRVFFDLVPVWSLSGETEYDSVSRVVGYTVIDWGTGRFVQKYVDNTLYLTYQVGPDGLEYTGATVFIRDGMGLIKELYEYTRDGDLRSRTVVQYELF